MGFLIIDLTGKGKETTRRKNNARLREMIALNFARKGDGRDSDSFFFRDNIGGGKRVREAGFAKKNAVAKLIRQSAFNPGVLMFLLVKNSAADAAGEG